MLAQIPFSNANRRLPTAVLLLVGLVELTRASELGAYLTTVGCGTSLLLTSVTDCKDSDD